MARTKQTQRGKEVAGYVRGAIMRSIMMLEEEGRPLSEILVEQWKENPLDTMRACGPYMPKDVSMEVDSNETLVVWHVEAKEQAIEPANSERDLPIEHPALEDEPGDVRH